MFTVSEPEHTVRVLNILLLIRRYVCVCVCVCVCEGKGNERKANVNLSRFEVRIKEIAF